MKIVCVPEATVPGEKVYAVPVSVIEPELGADGAPPFMSVLAVSAALDPMAALLLKYGTPPVVPVRLAAGNCDWQTFDLVRQTLSATTMWASANGLSEVNFFSAADAATACVYGGFNNGNDRITPPSTYLATVAGRPPLARCT